MLASLFLYAGLVTSFIAIICVSKPIRFLRIGTRRRALMVLLIGMLLIVAAMEFPIAESRISQPQSALDRYIPVYQFSEFHTVEVKASPAEIYRALNEVPAEEIAFFRTLTWIRRAGLSGPESILNPKPGAPILQVATRTGFVMLSDEPNREIVVGAFVLAPRGFRLGRKPAPQDFLQLRQPGFAMAVMNFRVMEKSAGQSTLTTETRIYATDPAAARKFHRYWSFVYPGSSLIRYSWLRAIRNRAEHKT